MGKSEFLLPTFKWGSLFYYDSELEKKDIFILCEVIEHIDENRLGKIFDTIFTKYKPYHVIVTTPNQDYNAVYDMNEAKGTATIALNGRSNSLKNGPSIGKVMLIIRRKSMGLANM
ncbi:hypothetical protein AAHH67_15025 [Niallia circulans]